MRPQVAPSICRSPHSILDVGEELLRHTSRGAGNVAVRWRNCLRNKAPAVRGPGSQTLACESSRGPHACAPAPDERIMDERFQHSHQTILFTSHHLYTRYTRDDTMSTGRYAMLTRAHRHAVLACMLKYTFNATNLKSIDQHSG